MSGNRQLTAHNHHSPATTHYSLTTMPDNTPAEIEHQHHDYVGNAIPWYVRAIWIGFWIFAVVYTIRYLFPALQAELFQRP